MANQTSVSPMKVLVCDRDPADRWLIGTYLKQGTEREIVAEETDQISELKKAADRGEVDLIVVDIDIIEDSTYWLQQIIENQLAPVVVLTGLRTESETEDVFGHGAVSCLSKNSLSREELNQAVDRAVRKLQVLRRNEAHKDELERLANYDYLTGLLNRRSVLRRLEESMARSRRYGEELSLAIFDVDRFRAVNEVVGRARADAALQRIGALLKRRMREADFVGRYGVDEFIIVLPHTDKDGARVAADRIRNMIEVVELQEGEEKLCALTVSAGLAQYEVGDDVSTMTYRAETCLCRAKDRGRNRVE